jgi:hypothetical protein
MRTRFSLPGVTGTHMFPVFSPIHAMFPAGVNKHLKKADRKTKIEPALEKIEGD